jgi:ABC-2 type transport system permease protein
MMESERDFKLKVYPALGMAIIFPFIFMSNSLMNKGLSGLAGSHWYLAIYLCGIMIPTVLLMLKHSSHFKGAWVYKVIPISGPRSILSGAVKAFVIRLLMPLYVVESFLFGLIFGAKVIPDLIVVGLGMLLFTMICFRAIRKSIPFSEPFDAVRSQEHLIVLPLLLVIGVLLGLHWASSLVTGGLYGYMLLLVIVNLVAWRIGFRVNWQQLETN